MVRNPRNWTWWVLAFLAVPLIGSCADDDITNPGDGMASVSVFLTDAPGDVEAVWVEVLELYLQGGPDGRVDLLGEPTELIPLTDLVGAAQLLVEDAEVDATVYNQLRMVIGDAVLVATDGSVYTKGDPVLPEGVEGPATGDLQCPSCSTSGLKIVIPNDEAGDEVSIEDEAVAIVLDFDVSQSFGHKAGNSGKWVMHPVIHATLVEDQDGDGTAADELQSLSGVSGTVALGAEVVIPECPAGSPRSIEDFIPTATSMGLVNAEGEPIVRTGQVDGTGAFRIDFLAPDDYQLGYVESLDLEGPQLVFAVTVNPVEVTVGSADVEGVTYTIDGVECVGSS